MEISNNLVLGAKYKDEITGFEGTATGFTTYITGCDQVLLVTEVGSKSEEYKALWFDIARLKRVGNKKVELPEEVKNNVITSQSNTSTGSPRGADIPAPIR